MIGSTSARASTNRAVRSTFAATSLAEQAEQFRALGDEGRLRIVLALRERELCVCQIVALLQLAPSTISRHLQVLRHADLIRSSKKGKWVHYRLEDLSPIPGLEQVLKVAAASPDGRRDRTRLREILKIDPDQLCHVQYGH